MANYYVSPTGDNGASGAIDAPWADPWTNIATVAAGDTVWINPGTYTHGTYWGIVKNFASLTTFRGTSASNRPVLTATDPTYTILKTAGNNWKFKDIIFTAQAASESAFSIQGNTTTNGTAFENCAFNSPENAGNSYCLLIATGGATSGGQVTLTDCTLTAATGPANPYCLSYEAAATDTYALTMTNVTASSPKHGVLWQHGDFTINGLTITGGATGSIGLAIGIDGGSATLSAQGTINNLRMTRDGGHGLLVGSDTRTGDVVITDTVVSGGDYPLVLKGANALVSGSEFREGSSGAVLLKGASASSITNCIMANTAATTLADDDGAGDPIADCTITDNTIEASGTSSIFYLTSLRTGTGNVIDRNRYRTYGTGNLGTVLADASVANKAELLAAWAGYDQPTNDANSVYVNEVAGAVRRRRAS